MDKDNRQGVSNWYAGKVGYLKPGEVLIDTTLTDMWAASIEAKEGRKDDQDKVRIDLFPGEALFGISEILTSGAKRYSDRNWEKGMKWGRVFSALMRHMWAWWQGKAPTTKSFLFGELDPDTQCSHLWHAGACVAFLIAYEERKIGEDDRPV